MVKYYGLHDSGSVSIGVFLIPRGGSLPLHNHPTMTVLSRVLYGQLEVTSFDWADPPLARGRSRAAARVRTAELVAGPAPPLVLFPGSGGNLHAFAARSGPCAVLDVIAPPYSDALGRGCTYYEEGGGVDASEAGGREGLVWLTEADTDFVCRNIN